MTHGPGWPKAARSVLLSRDLPGIGGAGGPDEMWNAYCTKATR